MNMTPEQEFKKTFDETSTAMDEGKSGADIVIPSFLDQKPGDAEARAAADKAAADKAAVDAKAAEDKVAADKAANEAKEVADKAAADAAAATSDQVTTDAKAAADKAGADAKAAADAKAQADAQLIADAAAKLTADNKAADAKAAEEAKAVADKAAADAKTAADAAPKPFEFSAEQKKAIEEFEKEWPDIAIATKIQREEFVANEKIREDTLKRDLMAGVQDILVKFGEELQRGLAPVVNTHLQSEKDKHFAAIRGAHKDYDEIIDLVPAWIKSQPDYMQEAMMNVYGDPEKETGGTAVQVIHLLSHFKKDTGRVQSELPDSTKETKQLAPVKPAAEKVAALSVVKTGKTQVRTDAPPPEDFETAFNRTADELDAATRKTG